MKTRHFPAFDKEMNLARALYHAENFEAAFTHLERAHIIGQRYLTKHMNSHWWMLRVGLRQRSSQEVLGQAIRMIAVVPAYLIGWVPKGNTGGANVSPLKSMVYPEDLAPLMKGYSVTKDVILRIAFWGSVIYLSSLWVTG